ncbi:PAS domain S-box protein [Aurantibacillus circumpalustris]|uniref:PAS domain S-box protein n=1 Tax=Aurantibacillus circumpalustris TaxID=3036359 RepID=UPI00295B0651|nr:PAS domain S-box protein [Aurantibacillus circumpalustris]
MAVLEQNSQVDEHTLNLLPFAVILFDSKQIYFVNKKAVSILGSASINFKKSNKISIFHIIEKRFHKEINRNIKKVLAGITLPSLELKITNFKKKDIYIKTDSNAVLYNNKRVIQTAFSEVSNRKSQITEDETAKDLLQKISANSQDVIFHFGFLPHTKLKFISDSSKKVLGFTPEEIYKNPNILKKNLYKEDQNLLVISREDYLKWAEKGKEKRVVVRFCHKNGKQKNIEIAVNPVYNKKRELAGLIGNIRDISERIETEKLLLETKKKFDLITNNGNDIISFYTFYPEEKYLYVSPNIKKILGYKSEDLINDHLFFTKQLVKYNDDFDKSILLLKTCQKRNIIKNHHFSFKILKKSGEEAWLEDNLVPITNEKGKISFFINILRDITEQKETDIEIESQYINYRNLLDNSPVAYLIHDNGVCLYVNNALLKLVKFKNKNQILGKFALDFFDEDDRKIALKRLQEIYLTKTTQNSYFNYNIRDAKNNKIEVEVKSVLIKFNNRDCVLSLVNNLTEQRQRENEKVKTQITESTNKQLQDEIKERKEIEKNLINKTAQLSAIFENSTHLIWSINDKLEVTSYNKNFFNTVKLQHGINIKLGYKIDEHLLRNRQQYIDFWYPKYTEAFKGKKLEFEKGDINNGRFVTRKIFINPIVSENNEVREISCIANDITDSKIYEQKLLNQTGKLSAIFDSSHHYIWTIDKEGKLTSFNKNYYDLITSLYNTKPFLGIVLNRGVLANDKEYTELLQFHYDKAFSGLATSFEIETQDKDHKNVYLEVFFNPIYENNEVVEVSGIAHNITEKKHVQQRMEISLKEKEVLLREVHHRVKNNMQVISSILNLQSSYVSDEYALTLLKESQNRIKTMAYIHESLYQNKSFTSVNFSDYVYTLVNNVVQSYSASTEKIKLVLNIDKVSLSLDSSIPAGLIINELITNAIKHAFPENKQGTITFNLRSENNFVFLELKDNGVGFASGIDFENSHSLGLQLVNTLIEQIEGKLNFKSEKGKGTEVLVTFKM